MENKPHCWAGMYWVLDEDFQTEKPKHLCDCNYGRLTCLKLTRDKAELLKNEIENLKENGILDVFNPEFVKLFKTT